MQMKRDLCGLALTMAVLAAFWGGYCYSSPAQPVGCMQKDLADITDQSFVPAAIETSTGEQAKRVCLTFDDGPSKNTPKVLEVLEKEGVPATFFVICAENNLEYMPLVADEAKQGMQIGLHSASHSYKQIYQSDDAFWADIDALKGQLSQYVDVESIDCIRFPGGSTNTVSHKYGGSGIMKTLKAQAADQGYHVVDWNVCADDAIGGHPSASKVFHNTIEDVEDQSTCVVLMHDTNATGTTVEALPDIIAWFRENGYQFCTVDALYE